MREVELERTRDGYDAFGYRFFRCTWRRGWWRWALKNHDGVGLPTHGAEESLEEAVGAALVNKETREQCPTS